MKLKNFLYLTQLEEYDVTRIKTWLKANPNREVTEVKHHLIWTNKIKFLSFLSKTLFFLPPQSSIFLGLTLLQPFDWLSKQIIVLLATLKLRFFHRHLTVIAITGSWGKTTSKDTLLHLIKSKFVTKATTANHNTLLGVAFDILHLPQNTQYFIAEIGAYHRGDIRQICQIIKPKIGIITAVGPMHLERFGSLENILNTKMELAQSIPKDGRIFLPETIKHQIFQIRLKSSNIVFFKKINEVYQSIRRLLDIESNTLPSPSEHRLEVIKNGSINIIDDTYNSNPVGFAMALDKLKSLKSKNNILITPGMIELGQLQESENSRLIKLADNLCQHLILVGQTNRLAFKSALTKPKSIVHYVDNIQEAQTLLPSLTSPGSAILFENDLADNYF